MTGDELQFAKRRIHQTAAATVLVVKSHDAITIDGLNGYETLAEGKDAVSGTPLAIYQVMLFDEGSYIPMQRFVGAELHNEYLSEFKAMAWSFPRKRH